MQPDMMFGRRILAREKSGKSCPTKGGFFRDKYHCHLRL